MTMAELQAASICQLQRTYPNASAQSRKDRIGAGLSLIGGVRELHGERCGWCDYELAELAQLRGINQPTKADERPSRKCYRHAWTQTATSDYVCARNCDAVLTAEQYQERARRGRTNRSRGNAIERDMGRKLGLRRVGQYGGPDDLAGELFRAQV